MRNSFAFITALSVGYALSGCNSNSPSVKPVAPVEVNPSSQDWTLRLQSKCTDATPEDRCVAQYGFTILKDGHYQLGPGPQDEVRTGTMTSEELSTVNSVLEASLKAPPAQNSPY